jgi:hypothetical protein
MAVAADGSSAESSDLEKQNVETPSRPVNEKDQDEKSKDPATQSMEGPADAGIVPDAEVKEEEEYPSSWKLALVTIALCLSVFCFALVCKCKSIAICSSID